MMIYACCDERRRAAMRGNLAPGVVPDSPTNGIDFLEVSDDPSQPLSARQRTLRVVFVNRLEPSSLDARNVRIEGGERIPNIQVVAATVGTGADDHVLTVGVNEPGDYSTYTLRLVDANSSTGRPPPGIDPVLASVSFSFKVNCPSDFDCQQTVACPTAPGDAPAIDYLARDFSSFRQMMLDRLATTVPAWTERNPADLGMVLVELLSYVGDSLSYRLDAIATEAYLGTARKRISVRRHARLVDYSLHDGCNARAWIHLEVESDVLLERTAVSGTTRSVTRFLTRVPDQSPRIAFDAFTPDQLDQQFRSRGVQFFEPLHDLPLYVAHNRLSFYTWGSLGCCLPRGATQATLTGRLPDLKAGAVLVFVEELGPQTGLPEDADPAHRHAVRLTSVEEAVDPLGGLFLDEPTSAPQPVTEIAWSAADALPFPLCISSVTDSEHGSKAVSQVSVAHGNIVLADHGLTLAPEPLPAVPPPAVSHSQASGGHCQPGVLKPMYPRYQPRLASGPVTQAARVSVVDAVTGLSQLLPFDPAGSAAASFAWSMADVLPAITLDPGAWQPRRDLLGSGSFATDFVVEIDDDGTALLRFGNDEQGKRPPAESVLLASYRVGNGAAGNIGQESIAHIITHEPAIVRVTNLLPASGGTEPESIASARQAAPVAFRTQERAVTAADYAAMAQRHPEVQRAAASLRWTGSWRTVFLTVDRLGGLPVDADFERELRTFLERYRMAGHDLEIDAPRYVSLEVELAVCVSPDYFRDGVRQAILTELGDRTLPDGRRGVFHPDNFTFGQPVYLSRIYQAVQNVAGVSSLRVTTFQRQGHPEQSGLDSGVLLMDRLEIARLSNDRNFPERGVLRLSLNGGK